MRPSISLVDSSTFSASRRISAATSEKPRPTSPALVPSSSALSASRSDLSATPLMNSTILPICCTRLFSRVTAAAMAWLSLRMRLMEARKASALPCPPWAAASVLLGDLRHRAGVLGDLPRAPGQLLGGGARLVQRAGLLGGARLVAARGGEDLLRGGADLRAGALQLREHVRQVRPHHREGGGDGPHLILGGDERGHGQVPIRDAPRLLGELADGPAHQRAAQVRGGQRQRRTRAGTALRPEVTASLRSSRTRSTWAPGGVASTCS